MAGPRSRHRCPVLCRVLAGLLLAGFFMQVFAATPEGEAGKTPASDVRSPQLASYRYPHTLPRSTGYRVWANGEPVEVLQGGNADFVAFECDGPVELRIEVQGRLEKAVVRPLSRKLAAVVKGDALTFKLERPQYLSLSVPGQKDLCIYANGPELNKPSPADPRVHYFAAGQVYEVGDFKLKSGETFYIEGGAVVKGNLHAVGASKVRIAGRGVLDGSYYDFSKKQEKRSIVLEECHDVLIEDIIMIHPTSWMVVIGASHDVHLRHLKQIGSVVSTDGVDICGSKNITIEQCFLRNEDDNIAIKSIARGGYRPWLGNIENVVVRDCVFYNGHPGSSMEIGFELSADRVSNIVFENIDILAKGAEGAAFSIHNSDRAVVENIRWENIRLESYWGNLVDLRVFISRFTKDKDRGRIRNILFKNIRVAQTPAHLGYSASLIGGASAEKPVEDVVFEDFYLGDAKVTSMEQLELLTRNCGAIIFR